MLWYVFASCINEKGTRGIDADAWEALISDMDRMASCLGADGEPLFIDENGESWGAVLLFGTGDMEQICLKWGLPDYNSIDELCPWRRCNRSTLPYTDQQEHALWRPTEDMPNDVTIRGKHLDLAIFQQNLFGLIEIY